MLSRPKARAPTAVTGVTHPGSLDRQYLFILFLKCTAASQRALWSASLLAIISCKPETELGALPSCQSKLQSLQRLHSGRDPATQSTHREARAKARPSFQGMQCRLCLLLNVGALTQCSSEAFKHQLQVPRPQRCHHMQL